MSTSRVLSAGLCLFTGHSPWRGQCEVDYSSVLFTITGRPDRNWQASTEEEPLSFSEKDGVTSELANSKDKMDMLHRYKSQLQKTTDDLSKISSETSLNYTLMFQKTKTYGFIEFLILWGCDQYHRLGMNMYGKEELGNHRSDFSVPLSSVLLNYFHCQPKNILNEQYRIIESPKLH